MGEECYHLRRKLWVGLIETLWLGKTLKRLREGILTLSGEKTFQANEKGHAKALGHKHAWYV